MGEALSQYLEFNPSVIDMILEKAIQAFNAAEAARRARELVRRKSVLESSTLPGKLADCASQDLSQTELFLVEGDSAGGSAVRARDPETQAILPIRGKILNVERARIDKMLKNNEVQSLITAIGAGFADDFDVTQARYHKVILLADSGKAEKVSFARVSDWDAVDVLISDGKLSKSFAKSLRKRGLKVQLA